MTKAVVVDVLLNVRLRGFLGLLQVVGSTEMDEGHAYPATDGIARDCIDRTFDAN